MPMGSTTLARSWEGTISDIAHGFLLSEGSYSTLDVPGSRLSAAGGVNSSRQRVGSDSTQSSLHGFLLSGDSYTTLDVPGSINTFADGINDAGQVVGWYGDASGREHGFLLSGAGYT